MKIVNQYAINLFAQGLGKVCTFGSNFIAFALIARICGTEFFGQYSYILNYLGILITIADFGLSPILARDIAQADDSAHVYWGNFLILRLGINVVVMALSFIAVGFIRREFFLILLLGTISLPFLASRFFEPIFQVYKRPWYSAYSSIFYGLCNLFFLSLAFLFFRNLLAFILVYILANAAYAVMVFNLSGKVLRPLFKISTTTMKNIMRLSLPLGISGIFTMINGRIPIFMLASLKSDYAVGIYTAAYKFLELSVFFASMVTAPLIPIFSKKAQEDKRSLKDLSSVVCELLAIVVIPTGIICTRFSETIVSIFFGAHFVQSAEPFKVLIWVAMLIFYSLFSTVIVLSIGVVHFTYWLTGGAALLCVVLNYLFIPSYGYMGSSWTALVCEIILVGVAFSYGIRHIGNIFRWVAWLKLLLMNLVLYMILNIDIIEMHMALKLILSLALYALMVIFSGIVDRNELNSLLDQRFLFIFEALDQIERHMAYLFSFIYYWQVKLILSAEAVRGYMGHKWVLPDNYRFVLPDKLDNLAELAHLLNSDGDFGEWSAERIRAEILPELIGPDSATIIYYKDRLIGCSFACVSKPYKERLGRLMWVMIAPEHRGKGLSDLLLLRTLAFFPEKRYREIFITTDTFRYAAIHLYLKYGARPVYDSLYSLVQWRKINKMLEARRQIKDRPASALFDKKGDRSKKSE